MEVNDFQSNYGYGWIKLYRSIKKHWLFPKSKPLTRLEAWIVILIEVNHDEEKVQIGYNIYDCNRGEKFYSLHTWSKLFNWEKSRTRRFLELLQKDKMIVLKNVQKTTHLTVCNYETYQGDRNNNETEMKRKRNDGETQVKRKSTPIKEYNNDNNDNNDNNKKNERINYGVLDEIFYEWLDYKKSKGKSYKSEKSKQLAYDKLKQLADNNFERAKKIVEQSMANNWDGLFELKEIKETGLNKRFNLFEQ